MIKSKWQYQVHAKERVEIARIVLASNNQLNSLGRDRIVELCFKVQLQKLITSTKAHHIFQ